MFLPYMTTPANGNILLEKDNVKDHDSNVDCVMTDEIETTILTSVAITFQD